MRYQNNQLDVYENLSQTCRSELSR